MTDNHDVIKSMIAAANRNDFDAQLACFTEDAEYRFDTYGIPGWPSAGELFTSRLCSIYEFRDGLICAERDYVDRRVSSPS